MNYIELFLPYHLAQLHDWISKTGELFVHFEFPHSSGNGISYLVRSLPELKELISGQTHPEIEILIFERLIFPLRGIADDSLLERATEEIYNGQYFSIISLTGYYPIKCDFLGDGKTHSELRDEFEEVRGREVGIGRHPIDYLGTSDWSYFYFGKFLSFQVRRTCSGYEKYHDNPGNYKDIIDMWYGRT